MTLRKVSYYKIINEIKFDDGLIVPAGTIVLLNHIENHTWYNVQYEDTDTKRIFWVLNDNIEFESEKREKWSKGKLDQYNLDITEKWLENEYNSTTPRTASVRKVISRTKKNSTSDNIRGIKGKTKSTRRKKEKIKRTTR